MYIKSAIITGPTGILGISLIEELLRNNVEILVLLRSGSARNYRIPSSKLITKKYCDLEHLGEITNETNKQYDIFFHFAWNGTTGESRNDMYMQNLNVKYSLDAIKCAKAFGCKRFIGAGSQAEYGRCDSSLTPSTPVFPENGYGIAKLCAGYMTKKYAKENNIEHIWVRILSLYGPNDGNQTMIMSLINKLSNNEDVKLTACQQIWDYLYCDDAARAFYAIAEKGIDGKTYVLGSGKARKLIDYVNIIKNNINTKGKIEIGGIPYSDKQVMHLHADIDEIRNDTGWEPKVSFEEGIKNILRRYK